MSASPQAYATTQTAVSPPIDEPTGAERLNRAQLMCELATDLGLTLAVSFTTTERLFFEVRSSPSAAALEIAGLMTDQFGDDDDYREGVIAWTASAGHLLAEAPGINAELKTASPSECVEAVIKASLTPVLLRAPDSRSGYQLAFLAGGRRADPNVHLLVELLVDRFNDDAEFATGVIDHLVEKSLAFTDRGFFQAA